MKIFKWLLPGLMLAVASAGCLSTKSPYDYAENWVIREDAVRPFMVNADIIYLQGDLYTNHTHVTAMQIYADSEVGNGRFAGIARVFSPFVACADDLDLAMEWYFKHHHEKGRCFAFIGEGEGGSLLRAYEEENHDDLVEKGLVATFYTPASNEGFVTKEMVAKIKAAVAAARYKSIWGRDIPSGMLDE